VLCTFADGTTCWMPSWRVDVQPERQWTFGDLRGTRAAAHQHLAPSPQAPDQAIVALPGGFTLYPADAALATWPLLVVEVIAR